MGGIRIGSVLIGLATPNPRLPESPSSMRKKRWRIYGYLSLGVQTAW